MSATQTLIPDISPLDRRRWKPFIDNEELECYSFFLPHNNNDATNNSNDANDGENDSPTAFTSTQLDEWFRKLHPSNYVDEPTTGSDAWTDATYKNQLLLRKTAWHTFDDECTCEYGYSDTWQKMIKSQKMINLLREITSAVSNVAGLSDDDGELNSVNMNYYPKGGGVGFHADDEFLFDGLNRETRIVSLSLCSPDGADSIYRDNDNFGARKFQVKRKGKKQVSEIILRHGDLMTMEGMFQKHYLHSVWPGDSKKCMDHELCQGERINLTWRTIVRHLDGSRDCHGLSCPLSSQNKNR